MRFAPLERSIPEDSAEALADLQDRNSRCPEIIACLEPDSVEVQAALAWLLEDGLEVRA